MTKNSTKEIPRLRFKGFEGEWESTPFNNIFKEKNIRKTESNEYPLMSFVSGKGVLPKGKRYDRSALVTTNNKKYKVTNFDDFIYSSNNFTTGSMGLNKTGNALISPVYSIFTVNHTNNPKFIDLLSKLKIFKYNMLKYRQGVVYGQLRVKESDFLKIKMSIPNLYEQEKIGSFFAKLDQLIDLQSKKLEQLKKLKRGYLQKMFPQKGESVPRLRFNGFSGKWESTPFNNIFEEKDIRKTESSEYPLMSFVSGKGVLPKGKRYDRSALVTTNNKKYKVTNFDDFIYSSNNFTTGSMGLNKTGNALISPVYSIFTVNHTNNPKFIDLLSKLKIFKYNMLKYRQGVVYGQLRVRESDFLKIHMKIPSFYEQEQIGKYLFNLDSCIEKEFNKINSLKKLKEAYLQKLFC